LGRLFIGTLLDYAPVFDGRRTGEPPAKSARTYLTGLPPPESFHHHLPPPDEKTVISLGGWQ
jgi:hypothetical protein